MTDVEHLYMYKQAAYAFRGEPSIFQWNQNYVIYLDLSNNSD